MGKGEQAREVQGSLAGVTGPTLGAVPKKSVSVMSILQMRTGHPMRLL